MIIFNSAMEEGMVFKRRVALPWVWAAELIASLFFKATATLEGAVGKSERLTPGRSKSLPLSRCVS